MPRFWEAPRGGQRQRLALLAAWPKTSREQAGTLYEGHDYAAVAANTDAVLLMTYEWGYTYGPPMAVAPLPSVRRVVEFALTEMPPEKIFLGFPNYAYDWTLPHAPGTTRAVDRERSRRAAGGERRRGDPLR